MPSADPVTASDDSQIDDFEFRDQAGHLVRRLHQIATSMFLDRCRDVGATPVQYAALNAIARHPDFEQRQIARLIAVDRTTINLVTKKLEQRGWIERTADGKRIRLRLTAAGTAALERLEAATASHGDELLAPLDDQQRAQFIALLKTLVEQNNGLSRVPSA
jgi:MarR family transcriptional regulator, lower aerobic nicotinate degradation pathway regulator